MPALMDSSFSDFFGDTGPMAVETADSPAAEFYTEDAFDDAGGFADFDGDGEADWADAGWEAGAFADYVEADPDWAEAAQSGISYHDAVRQAFPGYAFLDNAEIDAALETMFEDASDAEIFKFFRKLAPVARRVARVGRRVVRRVAPIAAPVLRRTAPLLGRVAGGIVGGPIGSQIGARLGQVGGRLAARGLRRIAPRRSRRARGAYARVRRRLPQLRRTVRTIAGNRDIQRALGRGLVGIGGMARAASTADTVAYIHGAPVMIAENMALTEADILESLAALDAHIAEAELAGSDIAEFDDEDAIYLEAADLLTDHIEGGWYADDDYDDEAWQ